MVTRDIPDGAVAYGNPARVVRPQYPLNQIYEPGVGQ